MSTEESLLKKIEAFLEASGLPETTFGHRAVNDCGLVADLRNGRELRRKTRERVVAFMRANRPQAAA